MTRNEKIIALFRQHVPYRTIGKRLKISHNRVCEIIHSMLDPDEINDIKKARMQERLNRRNAEYLSKRKLA